MTPSEFINSYLGEDNITQCVYEAINEASATNCIINLSHTLSVIADLKALFSILYSSKTIQLKSCWGPRTPPPPQLH